MLPRTLASSSAILYSLLVQSARTGSTALAFSFAPQDSLVFNADQVQSGETEIAQSRRSFFSVASKSAFGLCIASPSLSYASSEEQTNGKYIVLNDARTESYEGEEDVEQDPTDVVDRITNLWKRLESKYTQNGLVDYISIGADPDFTKLENELNKLQKVSLKNMREDRDGITAFVINLYNVLIRVAFVIAGIPKSDLSRFSFFDTVAVNIGGDIFTFNDMENGILRANSLPPYHLTKPFSKGDRRENLALSRVDPRIHFALNCGAKSCPHVKKYTAKGLNDELQASAVEFCENKSNVSIDVANGELRLSKIFKWYMGDFGGLCYLTRLCFLCRKYFLISHLIDCAEQLAREACSLLRFPIISQERTKTPWTNFSARGTLESNFLITIGKQTIVNRRHLDKE
ncbi:hypothetical protein ACHAW6_014007 [Cyclotella cf. meneghiniana]